MEQSLLLPLAYAGVMIISSILFLIWFFLKRRRVRPYTKYALIPAVLLIMFDVAIVAWEPSVLETTGFPLLIVFELIIFMRLIVVGSVGMYCAAALGYQPIPVMRGMLARRPRLLDEAKPGLWLYGPLCAIAAVGYSCLLFMWQPVTISETLRLILESDPKAAPLSAEPSFLGALVMLEFALAEEITFRLGLQNFLAKLCKLRGNAYWVSIVLTAAVWTLGHTHTLDPNWVKMAQIFPVGIALGLLFRRYGIEVCILVHAAFNLVMMFLAPSLISF